MDPNFEPILNGLNRKKQRKLSGHYQEKKDHTFFGKTVLGAVDNQLGTRLNSNSASSISEQTHAGSIILLNNNDIYEIGIRNYVNLYRSEESKFFIIWDWDNHHAMKHSMVLAAFSDFYIPAHFDQFALLADTSSGVSIPVPAGVNQWPRDFLRKNRSHVSDCARSETPWDTIFIMTHFKTK